MNSRMVRPFEIRATKTPTKGPQGDPPDHAGQRPVAKPVGDLARKEGGHPEAARDCGGDGAADPDHDGDNGHEVRQPARDARPGFTRKQVLDRRAYRHRRPGPEREIRNAERCRAVDGPSVKAPVEVRRKRRLPRGNGRGHELRPGTIVGQGFRDRPEQKLDAHAGGEEHRDPGGRRELGARSSPAPGRIAPHGDAASVTHISNIPDAASIANRPRLRKCRPTIPDVADASPSGSRMPRDPIAAMTVGDAAGRVFRRMSKPHENPDDEGVREIDKKRRDQGRHDESQRRRAIPLGHRGHVCNCGRRCS